MTDGYFCERDMMSFVNKLNLKSHADILVLDAPTAFENELNRLTGVRISHHLLVANDVTFALLFVTRRAQLEQLSKAIATRMQGDIALWFAYPRGPQRNLTSDPIHDSDWNVLRGAGFDTMQQVLIDANWSARRFRRREFSRYQSGAVQSRT